MNKKLIFICTLILTVLVSTNAICKDSGGSKEEVELTFWGLWDESEVFDDVIAAYQKENKNVSITYRKNTIEGYESDLLDALSTPDKGPDIFVVHNSWLPRYKGKLVPFPESIDTSLDFQQDFVDVVIKDFVDDNQIYSFPLEVDTLALYYNKDLLNSAGIASPPASWSEFQSAVAKIAEVNEVGEISQAGASIGTAKNINRAGDILSLLMMQSGTTITDKENQTAVFNRTEYDSAKETDFNPGVTALSFYTDFANSQKSTYTWNPRQENSIDAFINGNSAMLFGYSYLTPTIQAKAPKLNFGIAPAPQINVNKTKVSFANYWSPVVSRNASEAEQLAAWDFLNYIVSNQEAYQVYLDNSDNITSLRSYVAAQKKDPLKKPFAEQTLYASSFYQPNSGKIDTIFNNMIESVVLGSATPTEAIAEGASKVDLLFEKLADNNTEE